jgi:hypothetical protein
VSAATWPSATWWRPWSRRSPTPSFRRSKGFSSTPTIRATSAPPSCRPCGSLPVQATKGR